MDYISITADTWTKISDATTGLVVVQPKFPVSFQWSFGQPSAGDAGFTEQSGEKLILNSGTEGEELWIYTGSSSTMIVGCSMSTIGSTTSGDFTGTFTGTLTGSVIGPVSYPAQNDGGLPAPQLGRIAWRHDLNFPSTTPVLISSNDTYYEIATSDTVPLPTTVKPESVVSGDNYPGGTISTTNGGWSTTIDSYKYQWEKDDVDIPGAVYGTYEVQEADLGSNITCRVWAVGVDCFNYYLLEEYHRDNVGVNIVEAP